MITEEMVEKAARGISRYWEMDEEDSWEFEAHARAALEACESELLAQGMEKAAERADEFQYGFQAASAIRASAKQTREGKGP